MFHVPNKSRVIFGPMASDESEGNNGMFVVRQNQYTKQLAVIASDGMGWEHVSVSLPSRCPTWEEMCFVKGVFWDEEDTVVQYHPAKSEYVNNHSFCLHLWRPTEIKIPVPPSMELTWWG
jgi:hypothetical protein